MLRPLNKSFFVSNWETAEMIEIIYRGSYARFLLQIDESFRIGTNRRLCALKPGCLWEDKILISNKSELEAIFDYIDKNEDSLEALQVLYIYPEDSSPKSSLAKTSSPCVKGEELKINSCLVVSDRSSYQSIFAREVARRDGNKCLLCGQSSALEAAHIVEVQAVSTKLELDDLGIYDGYEIWNGLLLCNVCHYNYDNWLYGIDKDGFLWKKLNDQWSKVDKKNIYSA